VPVTREQAEGVSEYKRQLKQQMEERPLTFMEGYLASGSGGGGGEGGRGGGSGGVGGVRGTREESGE
jgi:hypothetical protein